MALVQYISDLHKNYADQRKLNELITEVRNGLSGALQKLSGTENLKKYSIGEIVGFKLLDLAISNFPEDKKLLTVASAHKDLQGVELFYDRTNKVAEKVFPFRNCRGASIFAKLVSPEFEEAVYEYLPQSSSVGFLFKSLLWSSHEANGSNEKLDSPTMKWLAEKASSKFLVDSYTNKYSEGAEKRIDALTSILRNINLKLTPAEYVHVLLPRYIDSSGRQTGRYDLHERLGRVIEGVRALLPLEQRSFNNDFLKFTVGAQALREIEEKSKREILQLELNQESYKYNDSPARKVFTLMTKHLNRISETAEILSDLGIKYLPDKNDPTKINKEALAAYESVLISSTQKLGGLFKAHRTSVMKKITDTQLSNAYYCKPDEVIKYTVKLSVIFPGKVSGRVYKDGFIDSNTKEILGVPSEIADIFQNSSCFLAYSEGLISKRQLKNILKEEDLDPAVFKAELEIFDIQLRERSGLLPEITKEALSELSLNLKNVCNEFSPPELFSSDLRSIAEKSKEE